MTVYKVKATGRWAAQVTEGGRKRQLGTYATKSEARAAERLALAAAPSSTMTVAAWRETWLSNPAWRESTRKHNRERTQSFADEHGHRRLRDVNRTISRPWAEAHDSTVGALRAMFGAAFYFDDEHGNQLLTVNPFSRLGQRKQARRDLRPDWLSDADVRSLEGAAVVVHGEQYGKMFAALIRFAAETGMRPGELFALRREDIDEEAGAVYVRRAADSKTRTITLPKNGRERVAVLTDAALAAVVSAPVFGEGHGLAFTTPTGRHLWQPSHSLLWKPVKTAAGRPNMAFHELRHFYATRLLNAGVTDLDVSIALGHTDGGELVRRVYGHPSHVRALDRVRGAMDRKVS